VANKKLFVSNFSFRATEKDLYEFFRQFGSVVSAKVVSDKETGESRGFGFVEFVTAEEAERGLGADGQLLTGRPLRVSFARENNFKPKEPRENFRR